MLDEFLLCFFVVVVRLCNNWTVHQDDGFVVWNICFAHLLYPLFLSGLVQRWLYQDQFIDKSKSNGQFEPHEIVLVFWPLIFQLLCLLWVSSDLLPVSYLQVWRKLVKIKEFFPIKSSQNIVHGILCLGINWEWKAVAFCLLISINMLAVMIVITGSIFLFDVSDFVSKIILAYEKID